jgi:hypothetical protein
MLLQGIAPVAAGAIHDTVAALVRDHAYRRSIWSSIIGRLLAGAWQLLGRLVQAIKGVPGSAYLVIGVVTVVVLLIAARILLAREWRDSSLTRRAIGQPRTAGADPWREAEQLAASGDHLAAAHALYQAVLRRLAGAEWIRLHPSKTSGDYARELRRRASPVAAPFQQFGRRFDRVVFGTGECSAGEFADMLRDASAVVDRHAA